MPQPKWRRKTAQERDAFSVPLNLHKGPKPGPEILPYYWHPDRESPVKAPAAFVEKLAKIDPDLRVTFSPVHERWIVWVRNPRITHWMCPGWQLLFFWEHTGTHEFLELNELIFHNLMLIDARRYQNGAEYFDKIEQRIAAGKEERNKRYNDERHGLQNEMMAANKINNLGNGSKSALHDDGSLVDSQGTANWRAETRKWRLPEAMLRKERDEKEQRHYGR